MSNLVVIGFDDEFKAEEFTGCSQAKAAISPLNKSEW